MIEGQEKQKVFGPCERKKAEKNYLPIEYIVETVYDEKLKGEYTEITKIKVGEKVFEIIPAHRVWDINMKFAGHHRQGYRMYIRDTETGKKYTIILAGLRKIEVIYDTELGEIIIEERIYNEDEGYVEKNYGREYPRKCRKNLGCRKTQPKICKSLSKGACTICGTRRARKSSEMGK